MKVYLVSSGSYSDYSVQGIYSTHELADEACKRFGADNDVEEFELDAMPELPDGLYAWRVDMRGEEITRVQSEGLDWEPRVEKARNAEGSCYRPRVGGPIYTNVICLARDEEHAKAIALTTDGTPDLIAGLRRMAPGQGPPLP